MCACEMSISSPAPKTSGTRTKIDMASCGAGPRSPFSIARSRSLNSSIAVNYNPRMRKRFVPLSGVVVCGLLFGVSGRSAEGQGQRGRDQVDAAVTVLKPARVFDGDTVHEGWAVRVKGE